MTMDTLLLGIGITILALFFLYEIIFILFFKDVKKTESKKGVPVSAAIDILIQPKPLGYAEPPVRKFEQCTTPVFEILESENIPEAVSLDPEIISSEKEKIKNDCRKAPTLVITSV